MLQLVLFSAHQNSVISTMVLEEIYFNRKKFCTKVFENAASELVFMGLAVVSYTLKTVTENQGYALHFIFKSF